MAIEVKNRRGTTLEHQTFTGAEAEITVNTDDHSLRVHDGITVGGHPNRDYSVVTRELTINVAAAAPNIDTTNPYGSLPNGWSISGSATTTVVSFSHTEGKLPRNVWFIGENASGVSRMTSLSSNNFVEWNSSTTNILKFNLSTLSALFTGTPNGGVVRVRLEF